LNHAPGDTINLQRPVAADDNALILTSAFGATADMAGYSAYRKIMECPAEIARITPA
jgi:hypothetical protein